ncbi:hypothetical protein [Ferruginibacter sp. HRS2-29]|uniref:hypothetical protein n=1 Tax=Ferruginibacter sp. HRS2-29 TaxID=2487334 RepID=UPI0020CC5BA9|nr:hypothetical protein [Ferruginibacter sp. HRS2-29]MCP9750177.1 hypothetical protein [Ferruginibacter sp. HRS2-29]
MDKTTQLQIIQNLINVYVEIFAKAQYIKHKDGQSAEFDTSFEKGCLFAYSRSLEAIKDYFISNDWDFDGNILKEYNNPYLPLSFKPKNDNENWQ